MKDPLASKLFELGASKHMYPFTRVAPLLFSVRPPFVVSLCFSHVFCILYVSQLFPLHSSVAGLRVDSTEMFARTVPMHLVDVLVVHMLRLYPFKLPASHILLLFSLLLTFISCAFYALLQLIHVMCIVSVVLVLMFVSFTSLPHQTCSLFTFCMRIMKPDAARQSPIL